MATTLDGGDTFTDTTGGNSTVTITTGDNTVVSGPATVPTDPTPDPNPLDDNLHPDPTPDPNHSDDHPPSDSDTIQVSGSGNNSLTGGYDSDNFIFHFDVGTTTETIHRFFTEDFFATLSSAGISLNADGGDGYDMGNTSQSTFSTVVLQAYRAWLSDLVGDYNLGSDLNNDGHVAVGYNQVTGKVTIEGMDDSAVAAMFGDMDIVQWVQGRATQTREFFDEFTTTVTTTAVTGATGHNTIYDFGNDAGASGATTDQIELSGLNGYDATALGSFHFESDGAGGTKIIINGTDAWIDLVGVTQAHLSVTGTHISYVA